MTIACGRLGFEEGGEGRWWSIEGILCATEKLSRRLLALFAVRVGPPAPAFDDEVPGRALERLRLPERPCPPCPCPWATSVGRPVVDAIGGGTAEAGEGVSRGGALPLELGV